MISLYMIYKNTHHQDDRREAGLVDCGFWGDDDDEMMTMAKMMTMATMRITKYSHHQNDRFTISVMEKQA